MTMPPMHHTAYKISVTRNKYGDYVTSDSETTLKCHFRYITDVTIGSNSEAYESDAMAWFEPDSGVEKEDLIRINDQYWRVEKVTEARRLRNPTVLFIKTELVKYRTIS